MKTKKITAVFVALIIAISLLFALSGCGSRNTVPQNYPTDSNSSNQVTFDESDLIHLIGTTRQGTIEILGQPSPISEGDFLFYPSSGDLGLTLGYYGESDGTVNTITLKSPNWTLCGLRTVNSTTRVNNVMSNLGEEEPVIKIDEGTGEAYHSISFSHNGGRFNLVFIANTDGNTIFLEATAMPSQIQNPQEGTPTHETTPEPVRIDFANMEINNTQLAGMIDSGEIPPDVTILYLSGNNISDLSPLADLTNLSTLFLFSNEISDLSPLAGLSNLEMLSLFGNPITDWSPVDHIDSVDRP